MLLTARSGRGASLGTGARLYFSFEQSRIV
jgi:hypothetical protein